MKMATQNAQKVTPFDCQLMNRQRLHFFGFFAQGGFYPGEDDILRDGDGNELDPRRRRRRRRRRLKATKAVSTVGSYRSALGALYREHCQIMTTSLSLAIGNIVDGFKEK